MNPKNGRKVNVNSKIGKSVLKNYMKQLGGNFGDDLLVPYADLQNMDLEGADLTDANLRMAGLEANLTRAILEDTDLRRAGLQRAILEGANLIGATYYELAAAAA